MSTKYVLAAAAVAAVAVTQTEASRPMMQMKDHLARPFPRPTGVSNKAIAVQPTRPQHPLPNQRVLDEEQADWAFNAGISGGAGGRPQYNAGISVKWDDEQQRWGNGIPSSTGPYNPTPPFSPFDEEQRVTGEFNAGISGGAGGRPQYNAGVTLRWDEEQGIAIPIMPKGVMPFDEQQADWAFNAGIQGGAGGRPQWNAGISAKWDEEEEQKLRLKKVLKTAVRGVQTYQKGQQLGVWDEEQAYTTGAVNKDDFNINLTHKSGDKGDWRTALGKAYDLAKEAQKNGFFDEEQADWAVNAGIQGGAGGRPQWNAGVSVKWDDEQQGVWEPPVWINRPEPWTIFDEEQAVTGEFNAGISGGAGGRPTYNAGVTIRWEEEEEQRNLLKKINHALGKVDNVVSTVNHVAATTQSVGALFEEERELTKAEQTLQQIRVIAKAALDKDLLTAEQKQHLADKLAQVRNKIDHGVQKIENAKAVIAQHKRQ